MCSSECTPQYYNQRKSPEREKEMKTKPNQTQAQIAIFRQIKQFHVPIITTDVLVRKALDS